MKQNCCYFFNGSIKLEDQQHVKEHWISICHFSSIYGLGLELKEVLLSVGAVKTTTLAETLCPLNANPTTSLAHPGVTPGYITAETPRHQLAQEKNPYSLWRLGEKGLPALTCSIHVNSLRTNGIVPPLTAPPLGSCDKRRERCFQWPEIRPKSTHNATATSAFTWRTFALRSGKACKYEGAEQVLRRLLRACREHRGFPRATNGKRRGPRRWRPCNFQCRGPYGYFMADLQFKDIFQHFTPQNSEMEEIQIFNRRVF